MAFKDFTSDQHAAYDTHSHGEETLATRGGKVPGQFKWSDVHPYSLRVLPKGSPPAGTGEINWENTLGGKFALAMEKLEGLLYAVFGSRPAAYNMSGTWRKCQWYDRVHPRCLWGPETWERMVIPSYPTDVNRYHYSSGGKEYAAKGEHPPCCPLPAPSVPIRTHSGDPEGQYATGVHDRTYFPIGSVSRDFQTTYPFDPEGTGWFGATNPGRDDTGSHPWLSVANGYTQKLGEDVVIRWQKPEGVPTPTSVSLSYRIKVPGGSWVPSTVAMQPTGDLYSATIPKQKQGTECSWYVKYFWHDPEEEAEDILRFDPGGATSPALTARYTFSWFTHHNPYGSGLPEMLSDYGGVDVRHGTDHFEFDGSETIQPELINLARWVLSWLGGDCCTGEYDTCAETGSRSDACHHNPRFRGSDDGICCVSFPIKFRWSGSNAHPHYLTGGKGLVGGSTPDSRPLHNHPLHVPEEGDTWGSEAARKSWRGINMLYTEFEHFNNPYYGGGYSWGTAPGTFTLMYNPVWYSEAKVFAKYPSWGLRPGDVIEAVHIQEIIDAVDYLIDYGVWTTTAVKTTKRTPGEFMDDVCGHVVMTGDSEYDYSYGCTKCCKNATDTFYSGTWCTGGPCSKAEPWQLGGPLGGGYFCPDTCLPYDAPTWENCWAGNSDKCYMIAASASNCSWEEHSETRRQQTVRRRDCDGGRFSPTLPCYPPTGGGLHYNYYACKQEMGYGQCQETDDSGIASLRGVSGASYFVCTPDKCTNGWDDTHGGKHKKDRIDHFWPQNIVATGPPGNEFSGNCLGDMFGCGTIYPLGADDGLWFHEVTGVHWRGLVPSWYSDCPLLGCGQGCEGFSPEWAKELPPPIPGYGYIQDDVNVCSVWEDRVGDCTTGHSCSATLPSHYPVCKGTAVWVAVDLNLDGSGYPYSAFHGRNGDWPGYTGRGVPRLRNYDLTKDPMTWMHDCPCETWTGAGTCVV